MKRFILTLALMIIAAMPGMCAFYESFLNAGFHNGKTL